MGGERLFFLLLWIGAEESIQLVQLLWIEADSMGESRKSTRAAEGRLRPADRQERPNEATQKGGKRRTNTSK